MERKICFENIGKKTQSEIEIIGDNYICEGNEILIFCGENKFLLEIEIINKSVCNITFGIGGPFNICKAFSKNNVSFIPFYHLSPHKTVLDMFNAIDNTIVQNFKDLYNRIYKLLCYNFAINDKIYGSINTDEYEKKVKRNFLLMVNL